MLKRKLTLFLVAAGMMGAFHLYAEGEECETTETEITPQAIAQNDYAPAQMRRQGQGYGSPSASSSYGNQSSNQSAGSQYAQGGQVQWMTNFQQAADKAKRENKYILLFFTGSDWCGWCKKIDSEVFADPGFARTVGNRFVFVELDFPMNKPQDPDVSRQNNDLKQRFGVSGYPTLIILDPNQNFVAETGYRPGGGQSYGSYLLSLIQGGGSQ